VTAARTALVAALLAAPVVAQDPPVAAPKAQEAAVAELGTPAAGKRAADRAIDYFVRTQNHDGSWGSTSCETTFEASFAVETHYAWSVAAHGLATMALLAADETPERRAALERAVRWLCNCRMTQRGSTWDNDAVWGWIYGTVATTAVAMDQRFQTDAWRGPVAFRGREFAGWLAKNQEPLGGFGYYDDPPYTRRP